jgi:hypothetical protein
VMGNSDTRGGSAAPAHKMGNSSTR